MIAPRALVVLAAAALVAVTGCSASTSGTPESSPGSAGPSTVPSTVPSTFPTVPSQSLPTSASPSSDPSVPAFADPDAAAIAMRSVREGLAAINSYSYRTLDADRKKALAATTGSLTSEIDQTYRVTLAKVAVAKKATQQASFPRSGLVSLDGDQAVVLAFGSLRTTQGGGAARVQAATVQATARRSGTRWLLSALSTTPKLGGPPAGSAALADAFAAARDGLPRIQTYSPDTFDDDVRGALAVSTGDLRTSILSSQAATKRVVVGQGVALSVQVTGLAVVAVTSGRAGFLVTENGYSTRAGKRSAARPLRLQVMVVYERNRWLLDDLSILR